LDHPAVGLIKEYNRCLKDKVCSEYIIAYRNDLRT